MAITEALEVSSQGMIPIMRRQWLPVYQYHHDGIKFFNLFATFDHKSIITVKPARCP